MLKRVLIITYYWPPAGGSGVQRWVKFSKYLRSYGWEPVIFTVQDGDYPILDPNLEKELPQNIEVIKEPIFEPYNLYKKWMGKGKNDKIDANFLSQGKQLGWKDKIAVWIRGNLFIPDAKSFWIKPATRRLSKYLSQHPIDAIVSTGPPHSCHLIAFGIHNKYQLPWIVDYRDPWTQIDYFNDLHLTKWSKKTHNILEKRILDSCSAIVAVGKTMAEDLNDLTNNRKIVITNGFDEADRNTLTEDIDKDFSIVYIGTMNDSRNPEALWQALTQLQEENHPLIHDLKVKLIGNPEAIVHQSVEKYRLNQLVEFTGYLTHKEAIAYQNKARLLLLVINRTSNNLSIITGKIFEYLASAKPILCIGPTNGDAADILNASGHNDIFDYDDVDGIKAFIIRQYSSYIQNHDNTSITSTDIEQYSRKNLTAKLAKLLDDITFKPETTHQA